MSSRQAFTLTLAHPNGDVASVGENQTYSDHAVTVGPGDVYRAELEARKLGVPPDREAAGYGHLMVQLWCAARRQAGYAGSFQAFVDVDLYDFDKLEDVAPVDPTVRPSPSASSSPTTSPAPPTG